MISLNSSPTISKTDLRREVAAEQARRALLPFTELTYPAYVADPFHKLLAETLDHVVRGEITRLMVFAAPQHGKSELTSVRLPAYWMGKRPDDPVILTSYASSLAESKSRQCRDIVEGPAYREVFPDIKTRGDSRSVARWELADHKGGMLAAGVDGPIVGSGGRLGIIDDPFANWQAAQSPVTRESVWLWYKAAFRPRIWEGGAIVVVMTRWHEDDLAGRLMNTQGEKWVVLRLPALAESQAERDENNVYLGLQADLPDPLDRAAGEPCAPSRYSATALHEIADDVGPMVFGAEYQGVPRPAEGNRFKRIWFQVVDQVPDNARRVRYWDKAGTAGGGAATAGVLMAACPDGTTIVEDCVQGHWEAGEREEKIKATAEDDAELYQNRVKVYLEQEPGSGGKESADNTIKNLAGYPVEADRPTGDKDVRLEPFAAQAQAGKVKVKRGPWNGAYIEELCAVPNGKYRDRADASAGAFNKLNGPQKRRPPAQIAAVATVQQPNFSEGRSLHGFGISGRTSNR